MTAEEQIYQEKKLAADKAIQKRFDGLCSAIFSSEQGNELIKILSQKFLAQPVADPKFNVNHAYFREGQNDLVRLLRTAIKRHANQ